MHSACMATKTISLQLDAYERLRQARRNPNESFSQVVLRAQWPAQTITAGELLQRLRDGRFGLPEEALQEIERAKADDLPPEDKWAR